jgi:hypothetical protein
VAINGDQITFQPGLAGQTIPLTGGVITISDKNIMIIGLNDLSVSGENLSRVFHITDGAVVNINNLDIINGFAQNPDILNFGGGGGGILVGAGSTLILSNSALFANHSVFGGAILASDSFLKIQNSVISSNKADYAGGGLNAQGKQGNVEISNSTFKFNTAKKGGAICFTNGKLKMTTTSIYQNTATGDNNTYGGGLYLTGTDFVQISFGTDFLITNSSIYNNSGGVGGGIYNQGNLTLINTTLSGNDATKGDGGGLAHMTISPASPLQGLLNITNSTITLNSATGGGGGVARFGNGGEFNFGNTVIAANDSANNSAPDIKGTVNSLGYNLIGSLDGAIIFGDWSSTQINPDPMLAPLAYNGGTTKNHFPQLGSPLINAGSDALAVAPNGNPLIIDQRGKGRFVGTVDIGAIEREPSRDSSQ